MKQRMVCAWTLPLAASLMAGEQVALREGSSVAREIRYGETHVYEIRLCADCLAELSEETDGGSIALRWQGPRGPAPNRSYGAPLNFVAETGGDYRLLVTASKPGRPFRYSLLLARIWTVSARAKIESSAPSKIESATLRKLQTRLRTGDAGALLEFWRRVETIGSPLLEEIEGKTDEWLVTLLWRARAKTLNVMALLPGISCMSRPQECLLARLAGSDVWYRSIHVPGKARFTYALAPNAVLAVGDRFDSLRQAALRPDPLNPKMERGQMADWPIRSIAETPGAPPQPWLESAPDRPRGALETTRLESRLLENTRPLTIYLPPGFKRDGPFYPVLIVFDDANHVPLATLLDNLIFERRIPPLVAAVVSNVNRSRELECNSRFSGSLIDELLPLVRTRYHVSADPALVIAAGISLSGLAAACAAVQYPESIGRVLAQSGSFYWAPRTMGTALWATDIPVEANWLAGWLSTQRTLPVRFYLEAGVFEATTLRSTRHLRDVLRAKRYEVHYHEYAGGHDIASWRGTFANGLIYLLTGEPDPELSSYSRASVR